jgi:hypothetical protein
MADNSERKVVQRRDPETGRFTGEFAFAPPELPPAAEPPPLPSAMTDADRQFMADARNEPPPLPEVVPKGPEAEEDVAAAVEGAVAGAAAGPGGAVLGGAAGFLISKATSQQPRPIGTLEGTATTTRDDSGQVLKDMLALQQQVARIGTPVKDAVITTPAGSRM